jgi:hypothetical protein
VLTLNVPGLKRITLAPAFYVLEISALLSRQRSTLVPLICGDDAKATGTLGSISVNSASTVNQWLRSRLVGQMIAQSSAPKSRGNRELRQTGFSTENALPSEMPSEWPQSAKRGVLGHSWRRRCSKSRYGPQLSPSKSMYSGSSPPTVNRSYLDRFYRHIYC